MYPSWPGILSRKKLLLQTSEYRGIPIATLTSWDIHCLTVITMNSHLRVLAALAIGALSLIGSLAGHLNGSSKGYLLVFASEKLNASHWAMVAIYLADGKTHSALHVQRESESPLSCAFALNEDASSVAFYNYDKAEGPAIETWSLLSRKRTSSVQVRSSYLETFDYNPSSQSLQGVCQMWVPEQNMSATCWCEVQGGNVSDVYQMPTDFFGETSDDCSSYIDGMTDTFWSRTSWYTGENRFYVGLPTSGSGMDDWKWFGALNGSVGYDGYAHDNALNRTFGLQRGADNETTQLIEILPGHEPYSKDNPMPKVIHHFHSYGLSKTGLVAYDSAVHEMYAIMVINGDKDRTSSLARINVLSLVITFQEIEWPRSEGGFTPESTRIWYGPPDALL